MFLASSSQKQVADLKSTFKAMVERCVPQNEIKIVVVGDFGVGKSALVNWLCYGSRAHVHEPQAPTIGCSVHTLVHKYKNPWCTTGLKFGVKESESLWFVNFYDFAGHRRYKSARRFLLAGADGAVLVFDMANANSMKNIADFWLSELDRSLSGIEDEEEPIGSNFSRLSRHFVDTVGIGSEIPSFRRNEQGPLSNNLLQPPMKDGMKTSKSFPDIASTVIGLTWSEGTKSIKIPAILVGTNLDRVSASQWRGAESRYSYTIAFAAECGVDLLNVSCEDPSQFTPESEAVFKMTNFYSRVISHKQSQSPRKDSIGEARRYLSSSPDLPQNAKDAKWKATHNVTTATTVCHGWKRSNSTTERIIHID